MTKDKLNVEAVTKSKNFILPLYILDKKPRINRSRSAKLVYIDQKDIEAIKNVKDKKIPIKVSRKTEIIDQFSGQTVLIHNGNTYIERNISRDMIGRKFGEFAETKKPVKHPVKKGIADLKKKKGGK